VGKILKNKSQPRGRNTQAQEPTTWEKYSRTRANHVEEILKQRANHVEEILKHMSQPRGRNTQAKSQPRRINTQAQEPTTWKKYSSTRVNHVEKNTNPESPITKLVCCPFFFIM
jgi:hypothetical protein